MMYSLAFFFSFVAVWALYAQTKRVEHTKKGLTLYLSEHPKLALGVSIVGLVLASMLFVKLKGLAIGLIATLIILAILTSMVVILAPMKRISWIILVALFAFCITIELIIT